MDYTLYFMPELWDKKNFKQNFIVSFYRWGSSVSKGIQCVIHCSWNPNLRLTKIKVLHTRHAFSLIHSQSDTCILQATWPLILIWQFYGIQIVSYSILFYVLILLKRSDLPACLCTTVLFSFNDLIFKTKNKVL